MVLQTEDTKIQRHGLGALIVRGSSLRQASVLVMVMAVGFIRDHGDG